MPKTDLDDTTPLEDEQEVVNDVDSDEAGHQSDTEAEAEPDEKPADDPKELRKQLRQQTEATNRLKGRLDEVERTKDYWHQEAVAAQQRVQAPPKQEPKAEDTEAAIESVVSDVDLTDLSLQGGEGYKKLVSSLVSDLKKAGVFGVTRKDVQAAIDAKADQMTTDARTGRALTDDYPELVDQKTEFAKQVNAEILELQKDRMFEPLSPLAMARVAADRVALRLTEQGKRKKENEDDRQARIARQGGGSAAPKRSAPTQEMTPLAVSIAKKLGVSEADFKKHQKELNSRQ